jgi:hypothetical protein
MENYDGTVKKNGDPQQERVAITNHEKTYIICLFAFVFVVPVINNTK